MFFYIVDQTVFLLLIIISASQVPGEVAVTVVTDAGKKLGMTCFMYIDEMREMVRQIVKDPTLQSLWFAMWSQEHGFFGNDSNIAQVLGPIDLQGQGEVKEFSIQCYLFSCGGSGLAKWLILQICQIR